MIYLLLLTLYITYILCVFMSICVRRLQGIIIAFAVLGLITICRCWCICHRRPKSKKGKGGKKDKDSLPTEMETVMTLDFNYEDGDTGEGSGGVKGGVKKGEAGSYTERIRGYMRRFVSRDVTLATVYQGSMQLVIDFFTVPFAKSAVRLLVTGLQGARDFLRGHHDRSSTECNEGEKAKDGPECLTEADTSTSASVMSTPTKSSATAFDYNSPFSLTPPLPSNRLADYVKRNAGKQDALQRGKQIFTVEGSPDAVDTLVAKARKAQILQVRHIREERLKQEQSGFQDRIKHRQQQLESDLDELETLRALDTKLTTEANNQSFSTAGSIESYIVNKRIRVKTHTDIAPTSLQTQMHDDLKTGELLYTQAYRRSPPPKPIKLSSAAAPDCETFTTADTGTLWMSANITSPLRRSFERASSAIRDAGDELMMGMAAPVRVRLDSMPDFRDEEKTLLFDDIRESCVTASFNESVFDYSSSTKSPTIPSLAHYPASPPPRPPTSRAPPATPLPPSKPPRRYDE